MKSWKFFPALLMLLLVLCGCGIETNFTHSPIGSSWYSPVAIPEMPTLSLREGMGGIRGCVKVESLPWKNSDTILTVYAAPFYSTNGDVEGFFLLEPSIHPNGLIYPDGCFQIPDVPPGAYVLVVGPSPEDARAFRRNNVIRVFHVEANQVLELGELALEE